jgi:hypothetical protein
MKKLSVLIIVIAIPFFANAQSNCELKERLIKIHQSWFDGLLAEDTQLINQVLANDVTLGFPDGNFMSKQDFLNLLNNGIAFYDSAVHEYSNIRIYNQIGIINGKSDLTVRLKKESGEFIAFAEKLSYTAVYALDDSIKMVV